MRTSDRGYALFEMIAAMSLVGVFVIVGGALVSQVFAVQREAARMEWATSRMDFAVRELRKDVWSAATIERRGDDSLVLSLPDDPQRVLTWRFEPEPSTAFPERGWLIRDSSPLADPDPAPPSAVERFEVPLQVKFVGTDPCGLSIMIDEQPIRLTSQVMLGQSTEVLP
ncbi:MAG: hypothetical protein AAF333_00345 [Planctomycetota bacterium]